MTCCSGVCLGKAGPGTHHEDQGLNVHERLHQAAADSWVAKATDAGWMGWAQQADGLIDEVRCTLTAVMMPAGERLMTGREH